MDEKTIGFPQVRLVAAGCLSLVLLLRVAIFDDSWQDALTYIAPCHWFGRDPASALITASLSLFIVTIISPVALRSKGQDRWLAALLAAIPFCLFFLTVLGLLYPCSLSRLFRGK